METVEKLWPIASNGDMPAIQYISAQAIVRDSPETLGAVIRLADEGRIRPLVSRVLPLHRAAEAHRIMEAGENTRGRLVLDTRQAAP